MVLMFHIVDWYLFFFFKQKTAYEMRISDWSSDVCSSDLDRGIAVRPVADQRDDPRLVERRLHRIALDRAGLVRLARQAPVGGEIDEDRLAARARPGACGIGEGRTRACVTPLRGCQLGGSPGDAAHPEQARPRAHPAPNGRASCREKGW